MIKKTITPQEVVDKLNSYLKKDKTLVFKLVSNRVSYNNDIERDKSIIFGDDRQIGMLSIINSFFGKNENGLPYICAYVDCFSSEIKKFECIENLSMSDLNKRFEFNGDDMVDSKDSSKIA